MNSDNIFLLNFWGLKWNSEKPKNWVLMISVFWIPGFKAEIGETHKTEASRFPSFKFLVSKAKFEDTYKLRFDGLLLWNFRPSKRKVKSELWRSPSSEFLGYKRNSDKSKNWGLMISFFINFWDQSKIWRNQEREVQRSPSLEFQGSKQNSVKCRNWGLTISFGISDILRELYNVMLMVNR